MVYIGMLKNMIWVFMCDDELKNKKYFDSCICIKINWLYYVYVFY